MRAGVSVPSAGVATMRTTMSSSKSPTTASTTNKLGGSGLERKETTVVRHSSCFDSLAAERSGRNSGSARLSARLPILR